MHDFLDVLARDAKARVAKGYYEHPNECSPVSASLRDSILQSHHVSIIAEIKGASPSAGVIRQDYCAGRIASDMSQGGAVGISVLTEPKNFNGSLNNLVEVRRAVKLPVLMKDIIISPSQLDAAARIGANAVLLIQSIFDRGYGGLSVEEMIETAHSNGLEALLEVHDDDEFQRASESKADIVGINNRSLGTLAVDLNVTKRILENTKVSSKIVVAESGIHAGSDIRFLKRCGAKAFLIGSAIMSADDVESKTKEFTMALSKEELSA